MHIVEQWGAGGGGGAAGRRCTHRRGRWRGRCAGWPACRRCSGSSICPSEPRAQAQAHTPARTFEDTRTHARSRRPPPPPHTHTRTRARASVLRLPSPGFHPTPPPPPLPLGGRQGLHLPGRLSPPIPGRPDGRRPPLARRIASTRRALPPAGPLPRPTASARNRRLRAVPGLGGEGYRQGPMAGRASRTAGGRRPEPVWSDRACPGPCRFPPTRPVSAG